MKKRFKSRLRLDIEERFCVAIAWILYQLSRVHLAPKPLHSNCIGEWITCGYKMDHNGFPRYPLYRLAHEMDRKIREQEKTDDRR